MPPLAAREFRLFEAANEAHKARFGFPFILCVRRHTRDSILDAFARRLRNTPEQEQQEALGEIGRIAALRLAQSVDDATALPVYGRLSTHVLDAHGGGPASGVEIELFELSRHGASRLVAAAVTNQDGRTDRALIEGRPMPIGTYELRCNWARRRSWMSSRSVLASRSPRPIFTCLSW